MQTELELKRQGKPYSIGLKIIKAVYPKLLTHGVLYKFESDDILACCQPESIKEYWRLPVVCDDENYQSENEFGNDVYLIKMMQEEFCWSCCENAEGRCIYGNRKYAQIPITYEQMMPFLKEDPNLMSQMIDKVPEIASKVTGKPLDRLKQWQHSLMWNRLQRKWELP